MKKRTVNTGNPRNRVYFYYLILAVITFAVYANSLNNQFVYDDESVILSDPTITSLSNIPKFFTGELGFHRVIGAYFRPVVSSSYAVDYAISGFEPFGFHFTNIVIHIICTLLLFKLLLMMFSGYESKYKDYIVLLCAGIFAVHPVHTEVVSWVSGRPDGLACIFFLAAFIYYIKYSETRSNKDLILTSLFYILSLFSKEMAITFPAAVLLYELIIKKRGVKKLFSSASLIFSVLILISILYLIFRDHVISSTVPRQSYSYFYGKDSATAFFTMLQVIPLYLRLLVLPYGLLYHYSGYLADISSPFEPGALIAFALLMALFIAVVMLRNKLPFVSFGILAFLVMLLPVMNIIPTPNFMAERFLYIPSIFFAIILCAVLLKFISTKNLNYAFAVMFVAVFVYGFMTVSRNADWKTNDTLFMSAKDRQGVVTYVNLGNISARKGNMDEAELYFRKAIDLRHETVIANNNLGKIFMVKGNFDSAYYYINKARELDTLSPEPLSSMAELHEKFEKVPEAVNLLEKLNRISPGYMNAFSRLAKMKELLSIRNIPKTDSTDSGNLTGDIAARITALEQSSGVNFNNKKYDAAIEEMKELITLNPRRKAVYYSNIGMCYLELNKLEEAKENLLLSLKHDPGFSTAYNNLGNAYERSGDKQKAIEYYEKALQIDPANQLAKQRLDNIR